MTTPHVTETRRPLEAVSPDPFVSDLEPGGAQGQPASDGEDRPQLRLPPSARSR